MNPAIRRLAVGTRLVAAVTVAGALVSMSAGVSLAAGKLIEASPASVQIEAPAPGKTQTWEMQVRSVSKSDVTLRLAVTGASEKLFSGPTPLEITLEDDQGNPVMGPVSAGQLVGTAVSLPDLAPGKSYHLTGHVTLPAEADNQYQNAGGWLKFEFTATGPDEVTPPSGSLAQTGSTIAGALAGAALLCGGLVLINRRRKEAR